jgi:hypothetical protein
MPHVRKGIRFEPKQAVMEPPRETYVGGARVRAITVDPRRQMRSVRLFADLYDEYPATPRQRKNVLARPGGFIWLLNLCQFRLLL